MCDSDGQNSIIVYKNVLDELTKCFYFRCMQGLFGYGINRIWSKWYEQDGNQSFGKIVCNQ